MTESSMKRVLALVPIGIGLVALTLFHVWMFDRVSDSDQDGWLRTAAIVTYLDENVGEKTPNARIDYTFNVGGQEIGGSDEVGRVESAQMNEGDEVAIAYDPQDSAMNALQEDGGADTNQLVLLVVADVIFVIASIVGVVKSRKLV